MFRGFVAGVFWGLIFAAAGLAVLSQTAPLPAPALIRQSDTATQPEATAELASQAPAKEIVPEILSKGAEPDPAQPPAQPEATTPTAPETPAAPAAPEPPAPAPEPAPSTDDPALAPLPPAQDAPPAAATTTPAADPAPSPGITPLDLFARHFTAPPGQPRLALVVVDPATPGLDRAALAALPFAVSFVIDPRAPGASDATALYRTAGQEVLMQAPALAADTPAAQLAETFQDIDLDLPEAVALADLTGSLVMGDLGRAVLPILSAQGRGLLTANQALASPDQPARQSGLPVMTIFASLDANANPNALRQALDQAADQSRKEGQVVIVMQAGPQTATLLRNWAAGSVAKSVALAPVSATLSPR